MTIKQDLIKLAEQCETAEAKEQAELIELAYDLTPGVHKGANHYADFADMLSLRAYESAALKFIPDGWSVLAAWNPTGRCKCDLSDGPMDGQIRRWVGAEPCSTPALAICAASLRAAAWKIENG